MKSMGKVGWSLLVAGWAVALPGQELGADVPGPPPDPSWGLVGDGPAWVAETRWTLRPSVTYDALCLLNVLTGDPFYLRYYQEAFEEWEPRLTADARESLAELRRILKDEGGKIISAFLSLHLSVVPVESLDGLLLALDDLEAIRQELEATAYFGERDWELFVRSVPHLRVALTFLSAEGFEEEWTRSVEPEVRRKIAEIRPELPRYDVVGEVERLVGTAPPSDEIEVILLRYSKPHGIRVTGARYLTSADYPFRIVLRNAIHEMLHPPYRLEDDPELAATLARLEEDPFILEAFEGRDPSFGYNTFPGLIEEDVVQALEQQINDAFGVAQDPRERWSRSDGGLHVFAAALYQVMESDGLREGETIRDLLLREISRGRLQPGRVRDAYDLLYGEAPERSEPDRFRPRE